MVRGSRVLSRCLPTLASPPSPPSRASEHSSHDFSLLTGAHLSLRLSLLDRSRCEEGDLVEVTAIVPKRGIIAVEFYLLLPAAAGAFEEEQKGAARGQSGGQHGRPCRARGGRAAQGYQLGRPGARQPARAAVREEREARSEVAGHLLD